MWKPDPVSFPQGFIFFSLCFYNVSLLSLYYIKESLLTLFTAREGIMLKKITKRDKLFSEKIKRLSQDWFNFDKYYSKKNGKKYLAQP